MNPFRRPLIAGNWKMNAGGRESCELAREVADQTRELERVDIVVAPPFTALAATAHEVYEANSKVEIAAQNMHAQQAGAFTGEVSGPMLLDAGATWVIIGHSERRQLFGETDNSVAEKVASALAQELRPIVCVGETLNERELGQTLEVVERQVKAFADQLEQNPGYGVIAYEPVWAIGTGKVASPADAQEVHAHIRALLEKVSEEVAESTRILYGGSVKADNAAGLLAQPDIDGALVGGASLKAADFAGIARAAQSIAEEEAEEEGEGDAPGGEGSDERDQGG